MITAKLEGYKYVLYGVEKDSVEESFLASVGGRRRRETMVVPAIHYIRREIEQELDLELPPVPRPEIPKLDHPRWDDLLQFQQEDVIDLVTSPLGNRLLAWSPGLGKTVAGIVAANLVGAKRVLVIAPASLIFNWEKEIERWSSGGEWTIYSYQAITRKPDLLWGEFDVLILDESGMIRNRGTKRFEQLKKVVSSFKHVWLLSGSPVANYLDDLWSQFHLIAPWGFSSYWRFTNRFCIVDEGVWGPNVIASRRVKIEKEFPDLVIRRNQRDVMDLPEFRQQTIYVKMTDIEKKAYTRLENDFIYELETGGTMDVTSKMAQITLMQKSISGSKHATLIELMEGDGVEYPMIVWTHWLDNSAALATKMWSKFPQLRISRVVGGDANAGEEVEIFQSGETDVLILSIEAMKFGHTLTAARTVVYLDRTFSGDAYYQSMLRVRRKGLEHSPRLLTLKCPGTVDDLIDLRLAGKMPGIAALTNHDLAELLRSLK
jgi:SNF2 family DNA or RNA helicase